MSRPALVTGGASGIGLRLAELLVARGDRVTIVDRALAPSALRRLGDGVEAIEADVTDGAAVAAAVARATDVHGGPPRLVVNSAGVQLAKAFGDLTEEEFRRVVDVNLMGSRNVASATFDGLEGGGQLVLIASLAGLVPNYGYAAYCASKYGVVGLAEVLRLEGRPRGIDVSVVCPPEVETPMVEQERRTQLAPSKALKELAGTIDVETAAQGILTGIDRRDFLIVPSRRARATRLLSHLVPSRALHAITDRVVARELR